MEKIDIAALLKKFKEYDISCEKSLYSLLNEDTISVVGSGSNSSTELGLKNIVFVNTSFVRMQEYKNYEMPALFIADGYFDIESILNLSDNQELSQLRKDKIDALCGISVSNIFTISSLSSANVRDSLMNLDIQYKNFIAISPRQFYFFLFKRFFSSFSLMQLGSYVKTIIHGKKPRPKFRPSNGVCAGIVFKYMFPGNRKIKLDGILSTHSYYGSNKKEYTLNNVHEYTDQILVKKLDSN